MNHSDRPACSRAPLRGDPHLFDQAGQVSKGARPNGPKFWHRSGTFVERRDITLEPGDGFEPTDLRITSALLYRLSYPGVRHQAIRPGVGGPSVGHARQLDHQRIHEQALVGVPRQGLRRLADRLDPARRSTPGGGHSRRVGAPSPVDVRPARRSRYTPERTASPYRRSSVRHRRLASRRWRSSICRRPGMPEPRPLRPAPPGRPAPGRDCSRSGARASSSPASSSLATGGGVAPVPSSRAGTDRHCSWRAANPRRRRAGGPGRAVPPTPPATESAWPGSTPPLDQPGDHRRGGHRVEAGPARSGSRWWPACGREVVGQEDEDGRRRAAPRSSSRAPARRVSTARWTSVTISTWRDDSSGWRWARAVMAARSSTSSDAPVRSTTTRSGWVPASARRQTLHSPQPPLGQSSAARQTSGRGPLARPGRTVQQVGVDRPTGRRRQLRHGPRLADHLLEEAERGQVVRSGRRGRPLRHHRRRGVTRSRCSGHHRSTAAHTAAATSSTEPVPSTTSHGRPARLGEAPEARRPPAARNASPSPRSGRGASRSAAAGPRRPARRATRSGRDSRPAVAHADQLVQLLERSRPRP